MAHEWRVDLMHEQARGSYKIDHYKRIITDRDTKLILESTSGIAKSANQIISESNLAQSTAYRKLKRLVEMNFLQTEYTMGEYGRWETLYKHNLCLFHQVPEK